jgi:hypothetical protein
MKELRLHCIVRRTLLGGLFLGLGCLSAGPLSGQGVVSRTPNLTDGWVESTGNLQFNFNHRFRFVSTSQGERVLNTPSFLLGAPIPGNLLLAGRYASNSLIARNELNEWEILSRWALPIPAERLGAALSVAYNGSAESVDGELSLRVPIRLPEGSPVDSIGLLGSGRLLSDALGSDETGWFIGGGVVLHFGDQFALSADGGQLDVDGFDQRKVWGASVQFRIPTTPHTLALQATNTRTATLQGASVGDRTMWGFEFTVPLTLSRYF